MAILKKDSLDGILSTFNKTIARLDTFATQRQRDADVAATQVSHHQSKQEAALADVNRSAVVREKISKLIA